MTRSSRATVNTYLGIGEPVAPLWGRRGSHIMYTRGQIGRLSSARPIVPKGSLGTCACAHSLWTLNSNQSSINQSSFPAACEVRLYYLIVVQPGNITTMM